MRGAKIDDLTVPDWLKWVESCDSTNTWAMEHQAQLQHGDVIFTRRQRAGRGQRGRVWYAPPGVIAASFVLDCISTESGLSLAAGLAVIYAVEDLMAALTGTLQLKWPNDVLIQGRKVAGVLCESSPATDRAGRRVIVGVGLNRQVEFTPDLKVQMSSLDQDQAPYEMIAPISLHHVAQEVPEDLLLLGRIRHYLLQVADLLTHSNRFSQPLDLNRLLPQIHRRDVLLGREVVLELNGTVVQGRSVGISADGQLLLCLPSNEMGTFSNGRVRWRT